MLSKYRQKRQEGFTIIEVLIVLAIAGLILLVVFLAVPALQRNSRNTQRSNDVAGLLGGMSEYVNNNNGSLPATQSGGAAGSTNYVIGAAGSNTVDVSLGYFTGNNVSIVNVSGATHNNGTTQEQVQIVRSAKCNGGNATSTGASERGYVALYTLENDSKQCRES